MPKTREELAAEMNAIFAQRAKPNELSSDQRMKITMTFLGYLEGIHTHLDAVRDSFDPQNPIDHNIEQAQIALENATMRLEQVQRRLAQRIDEEAEAEAETESEDESE